MQLQSNTTFASRYQLERLLGRGGFSEVWLAKDNWTHLRIALKVYAPGQGMDANGLQDFCGELANVFDLNHTNLLKPTHVDTWNDMPYLIMAYCSQGSLASKIGNMSEEQIWKLIHDVASGLAYLHGRDVVHQDIKPDNILVDEFGNYVITDFGISTRARSTLRKSVVGGSASGGTTAYMGPERFSRQPAPTKASDIWSFGAMVYEVLESNVPFGEVGGGLQKGGAEIPFITADVSDALKFTVYKMLSKETWDRPTAETLVAWSQAPQSIEIDYSLLAAEDVKKIEDDAPLDLDKVSSRQTQRFDVGTNNSHLHLDISPDTINPPAEGNSRSLVKVFGQPEWQISMSNSVDWIHIEKVNNELLGITCDKNDTGNRRTAHVYIHAGNEEKSVCVTQPSLPKSSKKWVWAVLIIFIVSAFPISLYINYTRENAREKESILHMHNQAVEHFDYHYGKANLDNLDALESALSDLNSIKNYENNKSFTGKKVYHDKRGQLSDKAKNLYEKADQRYQLAPSGTETEQRNLIKRRKINEIKQKI